MPSGPPGARELAEAAAVAGELAGFGITPAPAAVASFALYLRRIRQWSSRISLVAAGDLDRLAFRHLLESFNVLACPVPLAGGRLADAGSGAGFPGIPLGILIPDLEVLLIESVRKKARFLEQVVREIGLAPGAGAAAPPRVLVAAERAEVLSGSRDHRDRYSAVTLRGFGPLVAGVRACGALLRQGGILVAFKGSEPEAEIREALPAMRAQGLALVDIAPMRWGEGRLVLIRRQG